jgi:hypothetical protein
MIDLTHTHNSKNGQSLDVNISGGNFLAKITLYLFEKVGCHPKTREDSLLVARVLKNFVRLQELWIGSPEADSIKIFAYEDPIKKYNPRTIKWVKEVVIPFFEIYDPMEDE